MHPLDFLGRDDNVGLEFFPAMQTDAEPKLEFARKALGLLARKFDVLPMCKHAEALSDKKLKVKPAGEPEPAPQLEEAPGSA